MPNILFTASTLPRWEGDSEPPFVLDIAKNISDRYKNANIHILAPHFLGAKSIETTGRVTIHRYKYFLPAYETLCYGSGIVQNLKKNRWNLLLVPFFMLFQMINIARLVKRESIDTIHAHWLFPQAFIALCYRILFRSRVKIVCTAHGGDVFGLKSPFFTRTKQWSVRRLDHLSAVSQALLSEAKRLDPNCCAASVIPNAVDTELFSAGPKDIDLMSSIGLNSFCLLYVGRLVEKKGVKYLIRAMSTISNGYPDIKLLVIGDGQEKGNLEEEAHRLRLGENIKFLGNISNEELPRYYRLADIFIGPSIVAKDSDTEGFGITFIEAQASGVPVIATRVGGIPDVVLDNKCGILVPEKDAGAIADAAVKLLGNPNMRRQFAKNGRQNVLENFSWQKISSQYYSLYQKLNNTKPA